MDSIIYVSCWTVPKNLAGISFSALLFYNFRGKLVFVKNYLRVASSCYIQLLHVLMD